MTLIVSYARYPLVLQASDRRLTFPDGTLHDDNSTKSIVWNYSWLLSYTGLARLDNEPTYRWLALTLADSYQALQGGYIERQLQKVLAPRLDEALRRQRGVQPSARRLAVAGAGWAVPWDLAEQGARGLRPCMWHLSNFLDRAGNPTRPRRSFDLIVTRGRPVGLEELVVETYGQRMQPRQWARLIRYITRAGRSGRDPLSPARLIVEAIQGMNNPRVSKEVLVSSLPLASSMDSFGVLNRPPNFDTPSFLYVRPDGEWRMQRGPIIVDGGDIIEPIAIKYEAAIDWPDDASGPPEPGATL